MKRVKVMLSGILVMAIVAGALAFKVKTPNVCAYTKTITTNATTTTLPAFTDALLTHANTIGVETVPTVGLSTQYATTISKGASTCQPTTVAPQFRTLIGE